MRKTRIYQEPSGWIIEYPEFAKLADEQAHSFWPWDEPKVADDVHDLRVNMTPSELHGVVTTLKLFTLYEQFAGDDYWSGRIMKTFKRPEIQRMASMFSAVEMNSHGQFYNKINEVLYLDNEEFYSEWMHNPILTERMKFVGEVVSNPDDLYSIGAFTFIEGAVLYSSFAYLKHFQAQECGKDLIKNICRGIALSSADEHAHCMGGALLFRTILREADLSSSDMETLVNKLNQVALTVYDHECAIVDMIFEKGDIKGITKKNLKDFVAHRVNLCLKELGLDPIFDDSLLDGVVASWFYANINSVQFADFFQGAATDYHIDWSESKFGDVWSNTGDIKR